MKSLLGANMHSYSDSLSEEEEIAEWNWTQGKIRLISKVLSALAPAGRFADIGCRNGREAEHYGKACAAHEVHGFEIAEAPLRVATARGIITHRWVSGEEPCPAGDNSFDVIVAGDIIEHLYDTDVFMAELRRVLAPNGHLIITTPNLAWWWNRFRLLFGRLPLGLGPVSPTFSADGAIDAKHLRVSSVDEWSALFRHNDLDILETKGFTYPMRLCLPLGRMLDDIAIHRPSLAHSLLFLLRKR